MVKIRFWNKRKCCYDTTEFTESEWKNIVHSCRLSGIPLNAEVINS